MRHPSQADVLEQAGLAAVGRVKVALPAWVMSYDRETQTATVQVAVAYQVQDPETGERVARMRQPVSAVPVVWAGPTWDLEAGEWGLCVFADRSIDEWKATGNRATSPADPRRFDVTDATFFPGLTSPAAPLPAGAYAAGAVVLWDRGTGDLRLGGSGATKHTALAEDVAARLSTLESAFNSHVHAVPGVTIGAGATAASPTTAPVTLTVAADIAATKVKAE